ncbi:putative HicB family RNase H-like nuclease [Spirochaeta isovalerica]|uniref:Putative HicB family RNase H-like nuclease n=1 Tax=Spirochaeta isovalerica TaxID=150 RepID=A0A841RC25_9SPIO|nr:hypothetical protein [Spirochaeta isovalerica]MBB6481236.1 putative HicB family RNase H-like nuclease [Spirochaeta isovalerica]
MRRECNKTLLGTEWPGGWSFALIGWIGGIVEFDEEAHLFYGEVIGLLDAIAFQRHLWFGLLRIRVYPRTGSIDNKLNFIADPLAPGVRRYTASFHIRFQRTDRKFFTLVKRDNYLIAGLEVLPFLMAPFLADLLKSMI